MFSHVDSVNESFVTEGTDVRVFLSVDSNFVPLTSGAVRESEKTERAFEGFLSRVDSFVIFQMARATESLSADVAD